MSWGEKLREKCYIGKNVTGRNVTGRNESGRNGVLPVFCLDMSFYTGYIDISDLGFENHAFLYGHLSRF